LINDPESTMIGLAVYLNRKRLTVAGAEDLGVLNAIVSAVGDLGKSTAPNGNRVTRDLWLSVSGLTRRPEGTKNEHLQWVRMKRLRVGDKVTVQVIRTDRPDKHVRATVAASRQEAKKRMQKIMRDKLRRASST
jgi:ribosomal protein S1